jgi:hypothetical protein
MEEIKLKKEGYKRSLLREGGKAPLKYKDII